jgi:hypothetical protein
MLAKVARLAKLARRRTMGSLSFTLVTGCNHLLFAEEDLDVHDYV